MVEKGQRYGRYVAQRRLGTGGMAEAWMAVHEGDAGFEHRVCLKFIHAAFRDDAEFVQLFMNEAAIAALLRHSNIVGVIGASPEDGFMALELVDGCDLRAILQHAHGRKLPAPLVVHIAIHLCEALEYAHTRTKSGEFHGIVHRDISPGNVLISYAGEVKLTDFGIAKAMRATGDVGSAVKGKFSYMSPEQATGAPVDGRSDLFSLGTMLYELLAGQRPFDGATDLDTLRRVSEADHTPLQTIDPDLPETLCKVIERLLQRDVEARPASAAALLALLAPVAPPPTVCLQLGRVAMRARPHETRTVPEAWVDAQASARKAPRGPRPARPRDNRPTPLVPVDLSLPELLPPRSTTPGNTEVTDVATAAATRRAEAYAGIQETPGPNTETSPVKSAETVLEKPAEPETRVTRRTMPWLVAVAVLGAGLGLWSFAGPRSGGPDGAPRPPTEATAAGAPVAGATAVETPTKRGAMAGGPAPAHTTPPAAASRPVLPADRPTPSAAPPARAAAPGRKPTPAPKPTSKPKPRPAPKPVPRRATVASTKPETAPAQPKAGDGAEAPAEAQPEPARVRVLVAPYGQVWLDGKRAGRAPMTLELGPGRHRISAGRKAPEKRETLRVSAGARRTLRFVL